MIGSEFFTKILNLTNKNTQEKQIQKTSMENIDVKETFLSCNKSNILLLLQSTEQETINKIFKVFQDMTQDEFNNVLNNVSIKQFLDVGYTKIFYPHIDKNKIVFNSNTISKYFNSLNGNELEKYQMESFQRIIKITQQHYTKKHSYDLYEKTRFLKDAIDKNPMIFDKDVYKKYTLSLSSNDLYGNYYLSQYLDTLYERQSYPMYKDFIDIIYTKNIEWHGNVTDELNKFMNNDYYENKKDFHTKYKNIYNEYFKERYMKIEINGNKFELPIKKENDTIEKINKIYNLFNSIKEQNNPNLKIKMLKDFIEVFNIKDKNNNLIDVNNVKTLGEINSFTRIKALDEKEFKKAMKKINKTLNNDVLKIEEEKFNNDLYDFK